MQQAGKEVENGALNYSRCIQWTHNVDDPNDSHNKHIGCMNVFYGHARLVVVLSKDHEKNM